jgi:hypothetical protein
MTDDLRAARAKLAAEARDKAIQRAKAKAGREGVTRARVRAYEATHEALRAELECRDG